jgi:nucleoid-associated protein YgaU
VTATRPRVYADRSRRRRRGAARARRRGLLRLAVLVIVVVLVAWLGVRVAVASGAGEPLIHAVRAGDTVWGIAAATYDEETDLRQAVFEIERVNGLQGGRLRPGDSLVLPPPSSL